MNDAYNGSRGLRPHGENGLVPVGGFNGVPARRDHYNPYGKGPSPDDGDDLAVTLRQYLHMVFKRKWVILSCALVFAVLGGVRTSLKVPLYAASARIQIDREGVKVVEGGATSPEDTGGADFMRTQYEVLKSRGIAERVVSSLKLYEDSSLFKTNEVSLLGVLKGFFRSRRAPDAPAISQSDLKDWAIGIVSSNVSVSPVAGSRIVDIGYVDSQPARAQKIANAYAEAYVASTVDKKLQANSYAKTFLDDQIKQLKIKLESSEKAMLEFAEREKMVEVGEKSSIAENNLASANATVGVLISERIKNEEVWKQVEKSTAINLPQLLTNSVIETLRGQRKALQTEYQEKLENFKPSYPAMVQISNKIKEIDRQLAEEVKTIRASLKAAYDSSLSQEREMKARIETLREEVLQLQKKGIEFNILKREVETNRGLYNSLLQRYKEVDIAGGVGSNNVFIVDRATMPGAPSEPNLPRSLLLSLAMGAGAGLGLGYLLEMLDDRIRAPEELEQIAQRPTLGIIPRSQMENDPSEDSLERRSVAEAYRSLATALQFSTADGLPRSIAVTSAGPGEGKSTTAVALARHFAQVGLKVLLIDADLRRPSLHQKLQAQNEIGFSSYLTGARLPPELVQKTDIPTLAFISSGPLPPNAAELLGGNRMFSFVSLCSEVFDLMIFDAPPVLGIADAQLISSAVAATIFVVAAGEKRKANIRAALRRLQLAQIIPIGTVLTKFDSNAVGFSYAYGYEYSYGYGYEQPRKDPSSRSIQSRADTAPEHEESSQSFLR